MLAPNPMTFFTYIWVRADFQNQGPSRSTLVRGFTQTPPQGLRDPPKPLQVSRVCSMPGSPLCHECVLANSKAGWDPRFGSMERPWHSGVRSVQGPGHLHESHCTPSVPHSCSQRPLGRDEAERVTVISRLSRPAMW